MRIGTGVRGGLASQEVHTHTHNNNIKETRIQEREREEEAIEQTRRPMAAMRKVSKICIHA